MIKNKAILFCVVLLAFIQVPAQAWPVSFEYIFKKARNLKEKLTEKLGLLPDNIKLHELLITYEIHEIKERQLVRMLNKNKSLANQLIFNKYCPDLYGFYPIEGFCDSVSALALLLAHNADTNVQDSDTLDTPLITVAKPSCPNLNCLALLMACGARPEIANNNRRDALSYVQGSRNQEQKIQFMQNPSLAKKYVLGHVLPNLQLSQKTKDKLKARIMGDTKQSAFFKYLALGVQGPLYTSLLKNQVMYKHIWQENKQTKRPALPQDVVRNIMSFVDRTPLQEEGQLLKEVKEKATRCGHRELSKMAQEALA